MKLAVISFTKTGSILCDELVRKLCAQGNDCRGYMKDEYINILSRMDETEGRSEVYPLEESLSAWTGRMFERVDGLIYIGACGIAVRAIAPYLKDKYTDPAVIVVDELHHYAISLLSGHVGGANALTKRVAELLDAEPVITTASDVHGKCAIDVWAKEHGLVITDRSEAKKTAMKILESRPVGFAVDPEVKAWYQKHVGDGADAVPEGCSTDIHCESKVIVSCRTGEAADTLVLCPKGLCVGIGCKRGTSFEQLEAALHQVFFENHLSLLGIRELASIDLKKEEVGIHALADHLRVPFHTWTAEELLAVPGVFTESAFVKETTGVGNVCERAAVLAAGTGSRLLVKKQAMQGVTIAVAW